MTTIYRDYLETVIALAKKAGQAIMKVYNQNDSVSFKLKADDSPLTEADLIANDIISSGLNQLTPDIPVLSEEGAKVPFSERQAWPAHWLVDPLDGTNEFIKRSGQFTVNIALISDHIPVLGVSYTPVRQICYYACKDSGAFRLDASGNIDKLHTKKVQRDNIKVAASRNIGIKTLQPFLNVLKGYELIYFGASLKLCLVAEGSVDIYPRLGCNCEWDTAAGQCIVEEAGGIVVDLNFQPLRYNTEDSLYNPYFLVLGDPSYQWQDYIQAIRDKI